MCRLPACELSPVSATICRYRQRPVTGNGAARAVQVLRLVATRCLCQFDNGYSESSGAFALVDSNG